MGRLRRIVRVVLVVLALAGFLISFYLALTHYRDLVPPCYVASGCESVVTSRYSTVLGIPLSLVGVAYFAAMYFLAISLITGRRSVVVRAYDLLALAGVLAAVVLFLLQAVVLRAYCTYCLATEVIIVLIWAGRQAMSSADARAVTEAGPERR